MPTYQYRCTACQNELEAFQKFTDDALTDCPECGGSLRKVFNAVGIVFKGSGFYATDSRKSASKALSAESTSSESTGSSESAAPAASATKDSASKDSATKDSATKTKASAAA